MKRMPRMSICFSTRICKLLVTVCLAVIMLIGCQTAPATTSNEVGVYMVPPSPTPVIASEGISVTQIAVTPASVKTSSGEVALYQDPAQPVEARGKDLLARMTIAEKIGQMIQPSFDSVAPSDVTKLSIGSVLSGGGENGTDTPESWLTLVRYYQDAALQARLGIPLTYGWDAIHGNGHLNGGTLFPQDIGIGAAPAP